MLGLEYKLWVSMVPASKYFPFCHHRREPDETRRWWKGHLAKHAGFLLLLFLAGE